MILVEDTFSKRIDAITFVIFLRR